MMRESSKAALGGIVSALAVVVMLSTYISPLLVYTAPPVAGLLLLIIINEIDYKWAIGTYAAISLLSVFIIADKESAIFFTLFFGHFPISATFIDRRLKSGIIKLFLKFTVFNISCASALALCIFVLGVSYSDIFGETLMLTVLFIVLFEILFFVYNILVARLQELYILKFRKKIKKLFNLR